MSRPLVGSQVALAAAATIRVHILITIEQFSGTVEGTVARTVYISDTDIRYSSDGTVRHYQAFLHDPGVYTREVPHVTYAQDGDALYSDRHSFSCRNGAYVDDATGTEYVSFLEFLQVEEIEGSRVTVSELLVDPAIQSNDLSGLAAQEQTCVYRGKANSISGVDSNRFQISCEALLPEPKNVYVHDITGTTSLTTGDGPKGFTDEKQTGIPLPWNNSPVEVREREMLGLVAPLTGVVVQSFDATSTTIQITSGGQSGGERDINIPVNFIAAPPNLKVYMNRRQFVNEDTVDQTNEEYHPSPGASHPTWDAADWRWSYSRQDLLRQFSRQQLIFQQNFIGANKYGVAWCFAKDAAGLLPDFGPTVDRWRVGIEGVDSSSYSDSSTKTQTGMKLLGFIMDADATMGYTEPAGAGRQPDLNIAGPGADTCVMNLSDTSDWHTTTADHLPIDWELTVDGANDITEFIVMTFESWPEAGFDETNIGHQLFLMHGNCVFIEFEFDAHNQVYEALIGTEVIGFESATTTGTTTTLNTVTRGLHGTEAYAHGIGEAVTILTPVHPDCPYHVWLGSMGPTLSMGSELLTTVPENGPWLQNPRDGLFYWTRGQHDIIADTGDGGTTFQEVRDLLPDPFGCVIMDEEQLRNFMFSILAQSDAIELSAPPSQIFDFELFQECVQGDVSQTFVEDATHGSAEWTRETTHYHPAGGSTYSTAPDWADVTIIDDDADPNTIQFDADNTLAAFDSKAIGIHTDIVLPTQNVEGWNVKRWRIRGTFSIDNSGGGATPYYIVAFAQGIGAGQGLVNPDVPIFDVEADGVAIGETTYISEWFDMNVRNTKYSGERNEGRDISTPNAFRAVNSFILESEKYWTGFHILVYATDKGGTFHTSNSAKIFKDGWSIEFEYRTPFDPAVPPATGFGGLGVSYTDVSQASGIKMFVGVGGQDYTGLAGYVARYSGKADIINTLRFFLEERCGVPAVEIDATSFDAAFTNEFDGMNTGGSPSNVDMTLAFMEHEFGETFTSYMGRFCFELASQIILQHRQDESQFIWYIPSDPSTTQIDGLSFEYPTPTHTITKWRNASEEYKPGDDVFTHFNFYWAYRSKGLLDSRRMDPRDRFGQVSVAAPLDNFNPGLSDNFLTDTTTARNRYGRNAAPDQYFLGRASKVSAEEKVRVKRLARFFMRESLRMPVSIVTLEGVPWVEAYDIEVFDPITVQLDHWSAAKNLRVTRFQRDLKSQLTTLTAVEVDTV